MACFVHVYHDLDGSRIYKGGWVEGSPIEGQPIVLTDGTTWIVKRIVDIQPEHSHGPRL